jgi:acetyl/propionyl-CoA carboxylase alpha subunit
MRTLRRLGIASVAVHSDADAGAKHVREADQAVRIGESPAPLSYLNPAAIVRAALDTEAEAVHPGYGFLSESPMLARAVRDAGLAWIGPSPELLELTGDKVAAREAFERSAFPVLPGAGPFTDPDASAEAAGAMGYPVMVKAVMGGGGIGMGVARDEGELGRPSRRPPPAGSGSSATPPFTWSDTWREPAMSRCRSWRTIAWPSICTSGSVPFSAGIRR